jgi:hypothetical protein
MAAFVQQDAWKKHDGKQGNGKVDSASENQENGLDLAMQAALEQQEGTQR